MLRYSHWEERSEFMLQSHNTDGFIFLICNMGAGALLILSDVLLAKEISFHISSLPDYQYVGSLSFSQCLHFTKRLKESTDVHGWHFLPITYAMSSRVLKCNDEGRRKKHWKSTPSSPLLFQIIHIKLESGRHFIQILYLVLSFWKPSSAKNL